MGLTWCNAVWFGVMLGLMRGLVGLRAAHNQLGGSIPCVGSCKLAIEALHLLNNQLDGGPELSLAELGQLPALVELELLVQDNKIGGGRAAVALHLCEPH